MDQQLGLFFKCQSCLDYALTTNIQCPNGHQVCQGCFENLSHCPTCHQRVAPSTRIPFLLTTNVDPILANVGDAFDLILPNLLRIAPALHPCVADEMVYIGKRPADSSLNSIDQNTSTMQQNNCLADQLLMADSCEVEETLSRLGQMLASMSPLANTSSTTPPSSSSSSETAPPPGLVASSTPLPNPSQPETLSLLNTTTNTSLAMSEQQKVDNYTNF